MGDTGRTAILISASLFAATSAWFIRRKTKEKDGDGSTNTGFDDATDFLPKGVTGRIGSRGVAVLAPALPYAKAFFKCLEYPYDSVSNPEGHIAICVAENRLIVDSFMERLTRAETSIKAFSDPVVYCYNSFLGLLSVREAVAYFLARWFLSPNSKKLTTEQALQMVNPEHIALGSGCASLLSHLFYILLEEGDAVLIPAPYYAAFEGDMKAVARCVAFPVHMLNPIAGPSKEDLEIAALKAEKQGLRVRMLLLTNPNNPLGTIYRPEVVSSAIRWARSRRIHTLVDEIYALSTHKKEGHGFQSVLQILENNMGNDVHMIWAVSKDFGASGFRVGVLYTQNDLLLRALGNLNIFSAVSFPMQMIMAEILMDNEFVESFLDGARTKLVRSYKICTNKLEKIGIPYIPAEAGLFVYVDFSSLLPTQTFEGEEQFASLVVDYARVVMTPGQCQRDRKPGMFRICYAWNSPDVLKVAMERLSHLIDEIRRTGWHDLDVSSLHSVIKTKTY